MRPAVLKLGAWPAVSGQRLLDLAFFLLVPSLLSLTMALAGRYVDALGMGGGLLYVAALSFVPWWIAGLMTQLAHRMLAAIKPALWIVAAIGVVASVPLVAVYSHGVNVWFHAHWPDAHVLRDPSWLHWLDRVRDIALSAGRALVLWTAFVLVFASALGWARYGYRAAAADDGARALGRLGNSGSPWNAADDEQLTALVARGLAPKAIASEMGRTTGAIKSRMKRLDLHSPPAP